MAITDGERTLYQSATSVCSQKVRLVLEELQLPWRPVNLNLKEGDQFAPGYLSLNPKAVVPTMVEGDQVLTESNRIMLHLATEAGGALMAGEAAVENQIDHWLARSSKMHDAINTVTQLAMNRPRLASLEEDQLKARLAKIPDPGRRAKLATLVAQGYDSEEFSRALTTISFTFEEMENNLSASNGDWLLGPDFSLADAAMIPFVQRLDYLTYADLWLERLPNLRSWKAAAEKRPSFDKAITAFHPEKVQTNFHETGQKHILKLTQALSQPASK